jgi:hypothetical protein
MSDVEFWRKAAKDDLELAHRRTMEGIALQEEVEFLRAALTECAAPFDTGPTTVDGAQAIIAKEFQRRMDIAGVALNIHKPAG